MVSVFFSFSVFKSEEMERRRFKGANGIVSAANVINEQHQKLNERTHSEERMTQNVIV